MSEPAHARNPEVIDGPQDASEHAARSERATLPRRTRTPGLPRLLQYLIERMTARSQGEPEGNVVRPRFGGGKRGGRRGGRRIGLLWLLAAIPVLVVLLSILARVWTDVLWFQEVGFTQVYWTRIVAQVLTGLAGGVLFFAVFAVNLLLAWHFSPKTLLRGDLDSENPVLEVVERIEGRSVRWILLGISVFLAFFFALNAGGAWQDVLLFLNRVDFGFKDPIFGRDASFFVFVLPLAQRLLSFLLVTLILTLIAVVVLYLVDEAITFRENRIALAAHVKGHLSVLAAFALVLKAGDYLLSTWQLNYSARGTVFGASYTDVHAELPVLRILAIVALVSALLFLVNIRYKGWRLPLIAIGLMAVFWLTAGNIYPAIVQQYRVSPNEIAVESPYIADNIKATRWAFGLEGVTQDPFPVAQDLTLAEVQANQGTVKNIRLWDPTPLLDTYTQIQELRPYYVIKDVDVDRYSVNGDYRQVMLAAREMDTAGLQPQARTWVNQHLTYTHGYGAVVAAVNEVTGEGLPFFFVKDIPPVTSTNLKITRPGIYYGEVGGDFVMARTTAKELDYPKGSENVYTTYTGKGGIPIASFARRAAFSWRFGTLKLLLSDYLTPDSRLMFRRSLSERVHAIAPFLGLDRDPYMVIKEDGGLVWVWDAYTLSSRFPYSQPRANGTNYIRNSVKIAIDAYDGTVTFYQIDPNDAVANAWGKVFPGLDDAGRPDAAAIARPPALSGGPLPLQSEVLSTYHMTDPQVFYNKEDVWVIPREQYAGEEVPVVPYYVIMALPGQQKEEFLLLQPFAPLRKDNMISWMAARMDGDAYGQLKLYEFPKDTLIYGPAQIESRISNDPTISAQVTLWDQAGSRVIRGNLLVIPIEGNLVYVEPLYLQASQSPIPELKRVIVVYGQKVVMEPTLGESLDRLFRPTGGTTTTTLERPGTTTTTTTPSGGTTTTTTPPTTVTTTTPPTTLGPGSTGTTIAPGAPLPTDRAALTALAQQTYERALAAQRSGDWAEYGAQIQLLGRIITALEAAR